MSRYRQSFNEALAQVEKWSKDVEVKSTGEHAGKTIAQLKKEVDALRYLGDLNILSSVYLLLHLHILIMFQRVKTSIKRG